GITMATLDEIYAQADFITVHTPLNKETRHMINREAFAKMKPGVRIINCARGGIIDEQALVEAIQSGKVAGAALDVFEEEPPAKDNPLFSLEQVIVTPHLGASTVEAQENVALDVSEEILHLLRGEPFKNAVNLPSIPPEAMEKIQPYFQLCEKLGLFVAQMASSGIKEVVITYSGELRNVPTDPLTRYVMLGILSYYLTGEVNYVNALHLAAKKDIHVLEQKSSQSRGFTSLITVTLRTDREEHSVSGTLLNGFGARIIKIDNYSIDVEPQGHFLLIAHHDKPGMIGQVGKVLGDNDINIATMQVGRQSAGGNAIMLLSIDKEAEPAVLEQIQQLADIRDVREIDL
ncbi:MAG: phosphoglycerate dehydrogenase, partial [Bacillaceae bacterium G1]